MHDSLSNSIMAQPHILGAALVLCMGVAGTRVLRDVAAQGTVWWALGQVGGALCAALLAGLLATATGLDGPSVLAAMIAAAWMGVDVADRLAKAILKWLPHTNGNGGKYDP